jgi:hypothetical protein
MSLMERTTGAVLLASLAAAVSCGAPGGGPSSGAEAAVDTFDLQVIDTLGVLLGDSSEMFGTISQAGYDRLGRLLVMDGTRACIFVYSPEGGLTATIGRSGSGPGEFLYPRHFALLDTGGLVVCDWGAGQLVFFDSTYTYEDQISGFYPSIPMGAVPGPGGTFIASMIELEMEGEEPTGTNTISRWGRAVEPELDYVAWPIRIVAEANGSEVQVRIENTRLTWASSEDGMLYVALQSDSTYRVEGYSPDGTLAVVMEKPWERVPRTPEQMEEEVLRESLERTDTGSSVNRRPEEDPSPWHVAIGSLGVDDEGNVWIEQGYTDTPTFEIRSPSGALLRVARIPDLTGVEGLRYSLRNGLLAYDSAPDDYPKVYLLSE